jgi:hypothetical protein
VPSFHRNRPGSPKLHSLPDNSLNPLGLLAEASLANRRAHGSHPTQIAVRPQPGDTKVGVASDNYFKPGLSTTLLSRRSNLMPFYRPHFDTTPSTADDRTTNTAGNAELRHHR